MPVNRGYQAGEANSSHGEPLGNAGTRVWAASSSDARERALRVRRILGPPWRLAAGEMRMPRCVASTLYVEAGSWPVRSRKIFALLSLSVAALVLGACSSGASVSHGPQSQREAHRVALAMPPPTAAPATIVATYLRALGAHDTTVAEALLEPRWRTSVQHEVDSPLTDTRSITNIKLGAPQRAGESANGPYEGWQTVYVPATFELRQYHADSMPDGPTDWGYVVGRRTPHEPWRIVDEGVG